MSNTDSAPDATSAAYREGWAAEDARQGEDHGSGIATADELTLFCDRLIGWLNSQPEIAGSAEVVMDNSPARGTSADYILGLSFGDVPISMTMNVTP